MKTEDKKLLNLACVTLLLIALLIVLVSRLAFLQEEIFPLRVENLELKERVSSYRQNLTRCSFELHDKNNKGFYLPVYDSLFCDTVKRNCESMNCSVVLRFDGSLNTCICTVKT